MTDNDLQLLLLDDEGIQFLKQQLSNIRRTRATRNRLFDAELFADPAWDILLELFESELKQQRTSVTSCCYAARIPTTTGLRYISALCRDGIVLREPDPLDARRMFLSLSHDASLAMRSILADRRTGVAEGSWHSQCS